MQPPCPMSTSLQHRPCILPRRGSKENARAPLSNGPPHATPPPPPPEARQQREWSSPRPVSSVAVTPLPWFGTVRRAPLMKPEGVGILPGQFKLKPEGVGILPSQFKLKPE